MPVVDVDTQIHDYPMSTRGINIYSNILSLHPEECLFAQNVIWRNGIIKRGGQTLDFNDNQVLITSGTITVTSYSDITSGIKIQITVNSVAVDFEEGVDWDAATSNNTTASSIQSIIDANGNLTATVTDNVVTITPQAGSDTITKITTDLEAGSPTGMTINTTGKKILGIHRFYFTTGKQRLVACDTKVVKDDEDDTWTDIKTGLTTGLQTYFETWGALDKVYVSNGTDRAFSYDGTTVFDTSTSTLTVNSQPTAGQLSQVLIRINETLQTGIEGTDWDVGGDTDATATDIAVWLDSLSGIGAAAVGSVVTVTPTSTTDIESFSWSAQGTDTAAMVTVVHLALPAGTFQTLAYQDRMLIINNNHKGYLNWTKSFDDTEIELKSSVGVRPDTELFGMINHGYANADSGYDAAVLIAGSNSMFLFKGTDLRTPSTTGNYVIHNLAISVGCNAPRTMAWTPAGTMWLGIDRQVYLLPFDGAIPRPVGTKIQSNIDGVEGIEKIPALHLKNACATYHDGFYKLSVTVQGGTINTVQWWLDVKRIQIDEKRLYGPWYGPMIGQSIGVFANQNGPDDSGELIGGESNGKGYIYDLGVQTDDGDIDNSDGSTKAIQLFWQSFYNPLGNTNFNKIINKIEAELLDVLGTVNIDFHDITGSIKTGDSFGLSGSAIFWDDAYWDEQYWSSSKPTRQVLTISPALNTRRLSVIVKHNISNDKFELYSLRAEAKEQRQTFEGATFA